MGAADEGDVVHVLSEAQCRVFRPGMTGYIGHPGAEEIERFLNTRPGETNT